METKTGYVRVSQASVIANFTAQPTNGPAPLNVQFTDVSAGTVTSWLWSFGDGITSTLQSPAHVYNEPGAYTVSLQVTGPGGSDSLERVAYITVTPAVTPGNNVYLPMVRR
jgi:PKD repeat protein